MSAIYPINPDRNKPWNNLPKFPIDKELFIDIEVMEHLAEAKASLARLQGRSIAIPNPAILINTLSLQEAKSSSEIENIFTTDDELYEAFSKKDEALIKGPAKEVLNYREAIWKGFNYIQDYKLFDNKYLIDLYQTITQFKDGIRPELFRVYIKQGGSGPNAGKSIYTPPRGNKLLNSLIKNLLDFINDDENYPLDPLLKLCLSHFQFEAIHPFRDGNGRAGRILNIHILIQKELLDLPILYISKYIIEHKEEYYTRLANISQRGAWKDWMLYMLDAIKVSSNSTYEKINSIYEAKEDITNAVVKHTNINKPSELINSLFSQPFTTVKHLIDSKLYAENTARKYLNKLCELGILEKRTMSGHHYYLNLELYRILSE